MFVIDKRYGLDTIKDVVYRRYSKHMPHTYNMYLRWHSEWDNQRHMDLFGTISGFHPERNGWDLWNVQSQFDLPMFPKIEGFITRDAAARHRLTEMRVIQRDPLPIMQDRDGACYHKHMHDVLDELEAKLDGVHKV